MALTAYAVIGACAVGPNFAQPAPPKSQAYEPNAPVTRLSGDDAIQTLTFASEPQAAWWRMFHAPALDDLVDAGIRDSPTLASARHTLEASQDQARAGAGVFLPSVGITGDAARERSNAVAFGQQTPGRTFSLYTLTGSVSYALDLFGGERRQVEALTAASERQRQEVGAAYLMLTGSVVDTAIARGGYVEQVATLTEIASLDEALCEGLTAQYRAGRGAYAAVLAAEEQRDADRASLAAAQQRQAASVSLLSVLVGREPAEAPMLAPSLDAFVLPAAVPIALPSRLVRERPDILAAEASIHQASAQVGVATAALFPSISLTGNYGAASLSLASLAAPAGRFWSIGPTIDAPIFEGGERWFERKAAEANLLQAESDYRQTVLAALEQVSDALKALEADAAVADAARGADDAAQQTLDLATANGQAGLVADDDVITARIAADRARLALISARAQRLQDTVALYIACGGGWSGDIPGDGSTAGLGR